MQVTPSIPQDLLTKTLQFVPAEMQQEVARVSHEWQTAVLRATHLSCLQLLSAIGMRVPAGKKGEEEWYHWDRVADLLHCHSLPLNVWPRDGLPRLPNVPEKVNRLIMLYLLYPVGANRWHALSAWGRQVGTFALSVGRIDHAKDVFKVTQHPDVIGDCELSIRMAQLGPENVDEFVRLVKHHSGAPEQRFTRWIERALKEGYEASVEQVCNRIGWEDILSFTVRELLIRHLAATQQLKRAIEIAEEMIDTCDETRREGLLARTIGIVAEIGEYDRVIQFSERAKDERTRAKIFKNAISKGIKTRAYEKTYTLLTRAPKKPSIFESFILDVLPKVLRAEGHALGMRYIGLLSGNWNRYQEILSEEWAVVLAERGDENGFFKEWRSMEAKGKEAAYARRALVHAKKGNFSLASEVINMGWADRDGLLLQLILAAVEHMKFDLAYEWFSQKPRFEWAVNIVALLAAIDASEEITRFATLVSNPSNVIKTACEQLAKSHPDQAYALSFHIENMSCQLMVLIECFGLGEEVAQTFCDRLFHQQNPADWILEYGVRQLLEHGYFQLFERGMAIKEVAGLWKTASSYAAKRGEVARALRYAEKLTEDERDGAIGQIINNFGER
ncbi:MAG: hypothetical protein S4CHLAM102_08120 [Chlamydiia bacterium]|nr:hypothetical protein [Chlamydiia bacterium]